MDAPGEEVVPSASSPAPDFDEDEDEDTFPGDRCVQQIRSMHRAKGVLEYCVSLLAKVENSKRKTGDAETSARKAKDLTNEVVVRARQVIKYLYRHG